MRTPSELIEISNLSGIEKARKKPSKLFALGILAGIFIAFGAIFFTTVTSLHGLTAISKTLGGVCFSLGLILVVLSGAELFTGNNLMVISYLNKKIKLHNLIKNWVIVYLGNFVGSLLIVLLFFLTSNYLKANSLEGIRAITIANYKVNLSFQSAFFSAILCNILVCLAIRITMVATSISGKVLGIIFPISAFVAIGFEHSVANMFFIPMGLLIKNMAPEKFWIDSNLSKQVYANLNIENFFINNLLPVTLGNIVGGVFFVALFYWFIHREET